MLGTRIGGGISKDVPGATTSGGAGCNGPGSVDEVETPDPIHPPGDAVVEW